MAGVVRGGEPLLDAGAIGRDRARRGAGLQHQARGLGGVVAAQAQHGVGDHRRAAAALLAVDRARPRPGPGRGRRPPKRAAGAQRRGGWGRPWSHIGAGTTWSGAEHLALGPEVLGDAGLELGAAVHHVGDARARAGAGPRRRPGRCRSATPLAVDPAEAPRARAWGRRCRVLARLTPAPAREAPPERAPTRPPAGPARGSRCGRRSRRRSTSRSARPPSRAALATWSTPAQLGSRSSRLIVGGTSPSRIASAVSAALDAAGGAQAVAVHRLGRRDHACARRPRRRGRGAGRAPRRVADRRRGGVRVDVVDRSTGRRPRRRGPSRSPRPAPRRWGRAR